MVTLFAAEVEGINDEQGDEQDEEHDEHENDDNVDVSSIMNKSLDAI